MKRFIIVSISLIILLLVLLIILLCFNLHQQQKQSGFNNQLNQLAKKVIQEEQDKINENYKTSAKVIIETLNQAILLETVLQEKDPGGLSSKELIDFISERLIVENKIAENKIELNNGMFVEAKCLFNKCKFIVDLNGNNGPNKKWKSADKPSDIIELDLIESKNKLEFRKKINDKWVNTDIGIKDIKNISYDFFDDIGYVVKIEFNKKGAKKLTNLTKELIGKELGIFVDDELKSAPIVREPIYGNSVQISGSIEGFTKEEAIFMTNILNRTQKVHEFKLIPKKIYY